MPVLRLALALGAQVQGRADDALVPDPADGLAFALAAAYVGVGYDLVWLYLGLYEEGGLGLLVRLLDLDGVK